MLNLFGINFHIYGLLIGLSMWLSLEVSLWAAKKTQVEKEIIGGGFWYAVISGLIGARIYHVVDLWNEFYQFEPIKSFYLWEGGLGIIGGIIGGALGIFYYWKIKQKEISLLKLMDICVIGVPLAQAIGRWGNFANGEIYGKKTTLPWGIWIEGPSTRVHPLSLYESLLNLGLFGVLISLIKKKKQKEGVVLGFYLLGYGAIRFFLEFLRPEELVWRYNDFALAQFWSLLGVVIGLWLIKKESRHE